MQERLQKWTAWFKSLEQNGHLVTLGYPLETTGSLVKDKKGSMSDGPYAETKDIVAGFSIVKATDLKEASALAAGCPVFEQGGLVEVRPIMKM
jgi:hypothetical protein